MDNVIEIRKAHSNPLIQTTRYRCRNCGLGRTLEHGPAICPPMQICDAHNGCGAELSPIDENGRMEARDIESLLADLAEAKGQIEHLDKLHNEALNTIERLKDVNEALKKEVFLWEAKYSERVAELEHTTGRSL